MLRVLCILLTASAYCILIFFCKFPVLDGMDMAQVTPLRRTQENFFSWSCQRCCTLLQLCAFGVDGQMERRGTGEDEGWRKPEGTCVLWVSAGLLQVNVTAGQVQQQGSCTLPWQGTIQLTAWPLTWIILNSQGISESSSIQLITNCSWVCFL